MPAFLVRAGTGMSRLEAGLLLGPRKSSNQPADGVMERTARPPAKIRNRMNKTGTMGAGCIFLLALLIVVTKPIADLRAHGPHILAVILVSLGLWIFRDFSLAYFTGWTVLQGGSLAFGLPLATITTGFTGSAGGVLFPSTLTPSITVRIAIVMPIAMNRVEACKLPDRSRGAALICLVA
jgi:hypothetical protein